MIQIIVTERSISATPTTPVTSGSVGLPVKWTFSEEWDELVKTAVFRGSGEARDVALLTDECSVPADVLTESGGALEIGVYGRLADGTLVMPTIWARIDYIRDGALPSEVSPTDPEPDWTAQVQAAAAQALQKAQAVEDAAARGDFDGEIGPPGPQGEPGNYTKPATGIPEEDLSQAVRDKINSSEATDYTNLSNKPGINGVTLSGNKTAAQLGLAAANDVPTKTSQLQNDVGFLTQHQSLAAYRTAEAQDEIDAGKLSTGGDGSNVTAAFTAESTRTNLTTGEKLSVLFGKIAKWFADLGSAAFRNATGSITQGSTDLVESGALYTGLAGKYSKPAGGIPDSDIASAATWNAKGTYSKPSSGIPKSDLASDVQTSLGKADTALQSVPNTYRTAAAQDLIDAAQNANIVNRAMADTIGIVINGDTSVLGAAEGQYVILQNSTISGCTDGLYTARAAIPANTPIDGTYLMAVTEGGLNRLKSVTDFLGSGSIVYSYATKHADIGMLGDFILKRIGQMVSLTACFVNTGADISANTVLFTFPNDCPNFDQISNWPTLNWSTNSDMAIKGFTINKNTGITCAQAIESGQTVHLSITTLCI